MIVLFLLVSGMLVVVRPVLARMLVAVPLHALFVLVFVHVLMGVFMLMFVGVFVAMRLAVVFVFMIVHVLVAVLMFMPVFMLPFHGFSPFKGSEHNRLVGVFTCCLILSGAHVKVPSGEAPSRGPSHRPRHLPRGFAVLFP